MPLAPSNPVTILTSWNPQRRALAATYNRLGGLMRAVGRETVVEPRAALAVWFVESSGREHTPGQAVLHFECNVFYQLWGQENEAAYSRHFRHGGYAGQPGASWQNHEFREDYTAAFAPLHASQTSEYEALTLATALAGEEAALKSASIGGCQIVMRNCEMIGYASAREMYDAFQASERAHVLGFFDFCARQPAPKPGDLIRHLAARKWSETARYYNGPGKAAAYARLLGDAYVQSVAILPA